jgi:Protein of unknown function (DUF2946)
MARRRPRRIAAFAAWLGMIALAVQALIPVLVAAEIQIAATEPGKSVFTFCAFGHLHVAQPAADGSPSTPTGDEDQGSVCPICVALQAAPPFTAPGQIALPVPVALPVTIVIADALPAAKIVATAAYRSRAPPLA